MNRINRYFTNDVVYFVYDSDWHCSDLIGVNMKYVKKPVVVDVIEAWQFGGKEGYPDWLLDASEKNIVKLSISGNRMFIETPEGTHEAMKGDYIIKGDNGELYPCKPDIFEETYALIN